MQRSQFTLAGLLRATGFLAAAWWMMVLVWRAVDRGNPDAIPFLIGIFLIPILLAGAIGALLGNTCHGLFLGLTVLITFLTTVAALYIVFSPGL